MAVSKESKQSMSQVIKTSFIGRNPFKEKSKPVNLETVKITADKPKPRRASNFKYEEIFSQLVVGKSLSCLPDDCDKIGQALRDYIRRNGLDWTVKVQSHYNKTTGRVFVLERGKK